MICKKCGAENEESAKVCVKCGEEVETVDAQKEVTEEVKTEVKEEPKVEAKEEKKEAVKENVDKVKKVGNELYKIALTIFAYMWRVLLKPTETISKEKDKYKDIKASLVLTGTLSVVAGIMKLLIRLINCTVSSIKYEFNTFKNVKWFEIFIDEFIFILVIIAALAGICYIIGLIMKKSVSFSRLLGIMATVLIPVIAISYVVAPIVTYVYTPIGIFASLLGYIYTYILLLTQLSVELELENDDKKIFLSIICTAILILVIYVLGECGIGSLSILSIF